MSKSKALEVIWRGPFAWPGYEDSSHLHSLPRACGVYLQTFEYKNGYLIYAAGITRRQVVLRFNEHTKKYLQGDYNVLDMDAVSKSVRKEIWHGWQYAREHRDEFEDNKALIVKAVKNQLAAFRLFVAEVDQKDRIPERVEAAIMMHLYQQDPPLSTIPDQGMFLAPRRDSEEPIVITNNCDCALHGLPKRLEI